MSMTKKDFIALADELRPVFQSEETGVKHLDADLDLVLAALCRFMRGQNPQFDETRWREFLATGESKAAKQKMGDGLKLARLIVEEFGEAIETDGEINGGDAVDFITGTLYPEALAIAQDADDIKEGR